MRRAIVLALTGVLLATGALPFFAATPAQAAPQGDTIGFGMDADSIDLQQGAGIHPTYGLFWVGAWNQNHGWDGIENWLRKCKAEGVTPVIQWYYWGDDISPHNVENGVWSDMAGTHKTKAKWWGMTHTLGQKIRDIMGGSEAVVILESEFNKGGIDQSWYAPTFDSYLADHARILRGYQSNTKIVIGFGNWGHENWGRFPKAIETSDYLGFQTMRGSTRDSYNHYITAVDSIKSASQLLHGRYGKPTFLYDLALSTYPEMEYAYHQERVIQELFNRKEELRSVGLRGIVYRTWFDQPNFDLRNYYGYAERHWGLVRHDWSHKPAFDDWVNGVKAEMNRQSTSGGDSGGSTGGDSGGSTSAVWSRDASKYSWFKEAEDFGAKSTGGLVHEDAASGGKAWNIWTNGDITEGATVPSKGMYMVDIRARGDPAAGNYPIMKLYKNDGFVEGWRVDSGEYRSYRALVYMEGDWSIDLAAAFTNDAVKNGQDRNLIIDYVGLRKVAWTWVEAEDFKAKVNGGEEQADPDASGGAVWTFTEKSSIRQPYHVPATGWYHVKVKARGQAACGNDPVMELYVDGDLQKRWRADPGIETHHKWVKLDRGKNVLRIGLKNPCGGERTLSVDSVGVGPT